ncbi:MAG: SAM-dependent methyltransferase [Thermodesulfobacteriota bacterium]|nr:SAM-dependent methyltransferase [Thermodesulfobacteriota bacterium]
MKYFRIFMPALVLATILGLAIQPATAAKGQLFLVSTGNGDPGNITLNAVNTIKDSDVIFCHERTRDKFPILLQGKEIHDPGFGIFAVYGKTKSEFKSSKRFDYDEKMAEYRKIDTLIRGAVKQGKTVSVLCGGDPTIYGPNMWYMDAFKDLDPDIVTGVSCFNSANAALEKGITSGIKAHSVILTATFGNEAYDGPDSVEKLAKHQATMAFFTMFMDMDAVVKKLKVHYPGDTPVAIVQHAGYRDTERVIYGTLDTILDKADGEDELFEYMVYVGDFLK